MPTITFSYKDLQNLTDKKLTIEEIKELLTYAKAEFENYDETTDEITVVFNDTNLPFLWSVEGVARLFRGLIGKKSPKLEILKNKKHKLIVDKSLEKIRPYIAAFAVKGCKINDYFLKQVIDLQEKFCENYGRRRKKVAIGIYNYNKITFPVHYKATEPNSIKFIPLEFTKELTQKQILEQHSKGQEYSWILEKSNKYPILIDNKNNVLSFPPIINSNYSGKVEIGDEDLFFEATGEDLDSVLLAANIFAQAFHDRGYKVYSIDIKYHNKTITTPYKFNETMKINNNQVKKLLGLDLKESEIKKLLEKMNYNYKNGAITIPDYRRDIMHPIDIIEDIAISYGYQNIEPEPLKTFTQGNTFETTKFINRVREILIGLGYQEVLSAILSNKNTLYNKMNIKEFGTIELKEFMSETYSVVRSWIIPILMETLSKNKHTDYPQKLFEEGLVAVKKDKKIEEYYRIALVGAHKNTSFTEMKQILDVLMKLLGIGYEVIETEHNSFISGRVGRVIINNKKVGYIGEISPECLSNWELEMPVSAMELNLNDIFEEIKQIRLGEKVIKRL